MTIENIKTINHLLGIDEYYYDSYSLWEKDETYLNIGVYQD
jgi:hypothetical protein